MLLNSLRVAIVAMTLTGANLAQAQTKTAYQVGLDVAQKRGYANADCYAKVFAKHAVVTENVKRQRNWFAASTPAYNADQRKTCGIDRLADLERRTTKASSGGSGGNTANLGYRIGWAYAARSGYSGEKQACFAKVYATYAAPYPYAGGPNTYAIDGRLHDRYRQELFTSCGIQS